VLSVTLPNKLVHIVKNVVLNLECILVLNVVCSMTVIKNNFIVIDVAFVELVEEKIFFIVITVKFVWTKMFYQTTVVDQRVEKTIVQCVLKTSTHLQRLYSFPPVVILFILNVYQ